MATDPNKKTLRHFQCRDYLWEVFEQMSAELECSVDYLVNEAMRQYARARSQGGPRIAHQTSSGIPLPPSTHPGQRESGPPLPPGLAVPGGQPSIPPLPTGTRGPATRSGQMPAMSLPSSAPGPRIPPLPSVPPARNTGARPSYPQIPAVGAAAPTAGNSRPPGSGPPPFPGSDPALPAAPPRAPGTAALHALYQGQRFPVTKDEFVIGRGQRSSDLVIRDSNVSRRHAVVVLHNDQYWIVDQQSTNGVEYMGARIDRKRIEEGDVFKICDYEISFTYQ